MPSRLSPRPPITWPGCAGWTGVAGWRACFFDGDGKLVLELDAVAQTVVEVEVGHLIGAGGGIAIADPAEVNLPMLVAGSFGIVGAKGRAALRMRDGRERGEHREKQNQSARPLKSLSCLQR